MTDYINFASKKRKKYFPDIIIKSIVDGKKLYYH